MRRFLLYPVLALVLVTLLALGGVVFFREQIIKRFIAETSQYLATPVQVQHVDVSFWGDFPRLGIVFKGVYIEDSLPEEEPLLEAEAVAFYIDPIAFLQGQYKVLGLEIYEGDINLKINRNGQSNYTVFKNQDRSSQSVTFKLENIQIAEVDISYQEEKSNRRYLFTSHTMDASISVVDGRYDIVTDGQLTIGYLGDLSNPWFREKTMEIDAKIRYSPDEEQLSIASSVISLGKTKFEVKGKYIKNRVDLFCEGKNTSIQTLLSLMPEDLSSQLSQYSSEGKVYFDMSLKGPVGVGRNPALSVRFGLANTSLFHPAYSSRMNKVNLDGTFSTPSIGDMSQASLSLKNVQGELDGQPFEGEISVQNLQDPYLNLRFKGDFTAGSLINFYPIQGIDSLSGNLGIDVFFEGQVGLLKDKENLGKVTADGVIELQNVHLSYNRQRAQFRNLNGTLRFNNNSLMLDQLSGRFNQTDLEVSGLLQNLVPFIVSEEQYLGIRIDVKSPSIDVENLLALAVASDSPLTQPAEGSKKSLIPPRVEIRLTCDFDVLHYDRLLLRNMTGDVVVKKQFISLNNLVFDGMGGRLTGHGALDAKNPRAIDLIGSIEIKNSNVDSLFYAFRNFGQDFVGDKNLKGKLNTTIDFEAVLNERFEVFPETVIANIDFSLKEGEINNLEALRAMSKYIPGNRDVNHVVFAELRNNVIIKDKTITIPPMTVKSNILTFDVGGTHTFNQEIEYRLAIPLTSNQQINSDDEAFGAVEKNSSGGGLKLLLKVTGTTSKYRISYDREAVRKKFNTKTQEEITELKETFRNKGKEKMEDMAIEENSSFDWDTPPEDEKNTPSPKP